MATNLLLDTRVWIWMALEPVKLPPSVRTQIKPARLEKRLYIAAISLYEVACLHHRKRIDLGLPLPERFALFFQQPDLHVVPLTPQVAAASALLPSDFHGDPSDRLIAATAIIHNMTLCTHDQTLLRFGQQGTYRFLEV